MRRLSFVCLAVFACTTSLSSAASSEDPLSHWHELPNDAILHDVTAADFALGQWVAGTKLGRILTVPDGRNWVVTNVAGADAIVSVRFGGSGWVALDGSGKLFTSVDGQGWTRDDWRP